MVDQLASESKEEPILELIIKFYPQSNKTVVSGVIENKILSYGMLESAKDAIRDYHNSQKVDMKPVNHNHNILNFMRGRK